MLDMDSRDSATQSSAGAPPATEASTSSNGGEDYAALSAADALAKDAQLHFRSRVFSDCLEVLNQLKQNKEDDPAVLHNIALAEYFRDGCSDTKKLLDVLNSVKAQRKSRVPAHASGEPHETLGNKVVPSSKGSDTTTHQLSDEDIVTLVYMNEFDPAVATLNIAIIWFHLHEYSKALSVLEPLYHNIEPIDKKTALHVCLLLLDVALACQDASKSADVLLYLEKEFSVNSASQDDNGSGTVQQPTNLTTKSTPISNSSIAVDSHNSDLVVSGNALESSLSRSLSLSEDSLEYESMFSLDISGQSIGKPPGFSSSIDFSRTSADRSISTTLDLKLKLQLCKVRFLLLTRNLKHAKREVKLAMNIARGRDSSMALLLKSQLEYARGNHRKAIKLLMASSNRTEMGISNMFNNLGCIYYQLGNYNTSSVLFSKALSSCSSLRKNNPLKLLTLSQDKSLFILYNCGVQHLACGKPLMAARCFQKASLLFYNRPILWLRLAECCIMALQKGLITGSRASSGKSDILVRAVGKGLWRYLEVHSGISKNGVDSAGKDVRTSLGNGQPELSMSFARHCLLNALHLLDYSELNHLNYGLPSSFSMEENESGDTLKNSNNKNLTGGDSKHSAGSSQIKANGDAKEQKGGGTSQELMQNSISYYEDVHRRENQMIKQALLANLAYVELELENPDKALSTAMSLFELPECSRIFVFLGHLYAAESLCLLNKPKEAAEHVSIYLSGGDNVELPFKQEDFEQLQVEKTLDSEESNGAPSAQNKPSSSSSPSVAFLKPDEGLGTLYANAAATYAALGEINLAKNFITKALSLIPGSREATLTAVYLDLLEGKSKSAIARLRQCDRVRYVSGSVQLSRS